MKKINNKKQIKPKLYIIPGWGEKITQKNYHNLIDSINNKYNVIPIEYVSTKGRLFSENIKQAKNQIIGSTSNDVILGFSVGALIAYKLVTKMKFKLAIICSISAILEKDLLLYPKKERDKIFTPVEIQELNKMVYGRPISPIVIFYGSLETPEMIERSKKLHEQFGGTLISIGKYNHRLTGNYLEVVKKQL